MIDQALMAPLKGDGNDIAVAHERSRYLDVEPLEIPCTDMRKDQPGCHHNRVRVERSGVRPRLRQHEHEPASPTRCTTM